MLALVIGATIAGYTLVDNEGIEHASALAYLELVLLPVAVAAVIAHAATGRLASVRAEIGWPAIAAGVTSFAAYALALAALSLAPAAAVAAVRETGILVAVALGAIVLREPVGPARIGGRGARRRRRRTRGHDLTRACTLLSFAHHISPASRNGRAAPILFERPLFRRRRRRTD